MITAGSAPPVRASAVGCGIGGPVSFIPTMNCEHCGANNPELVRSSLVSNGSRRRRYCCRRCKHRWTTWTGDRPQQGQAPGAKRGPAAPCLPPLTEDQVRLILTQVDLSDTAMAKQLGRTRESVRQVRVGMTFIDSCPELPRRKVTTEAEAPAAMTVSCLSCRNWRGERGCGFELPDPVEEGIGFAIDCILYAT